MMRNTILMRTALALMLVSLIALSACAGQKAAPSEPVQQHSKETAPPAEDASEAIDVVSADEVDIGELY